MRMCQPNPTQRTRRSGPTIARAGRIFFFGRVFYLDLYTSPLTTESMLGLGLRARARARVKARVRARARRLEKLELAVY